MSARPLVVCGPSGVGKGTLITKLLQDFPGVFGFSVSHTSRKPRPGEQDGVHYNFVERDAMKADIEAGLFIEHAEFAGNMYGTSVNAVQNVTAQKKICVLDIDIQGARQVRAKPEIDAAFVFVRPPSFEELERRLRSRGTETEEAIQKRLRTAAAELAALEAEPQLFDQVIVNDKLEDAYAALKQFIRSSIKSDLA